jgi:hypothetical protein
MTTLCTSQPHAPPVGLGDMHPHRESPPVRNVLLAKHPVPISVTVSSVKQGHLSTQLRVLVKSALLDIMHQEL